MTKICKLCSLARLSILATVVFGSIFSISRMAAADASCATAREAMAAASKIRGLKIKNTVPCLIHNQEQVKAFIIENVEKKTPQAKLRLEELVFKALGVVPPNFDYQKGIVDLYLSNLGGYYDPDRKHFVMAGWMPEMMQPTIAAHELTHALQDQYFNLNSMLDPKSENTDEQLAHSALIEGDATAVMMDYMRAQMGQPGIATEPDVGSMMMQNVVGVAFTAGMSGVPEALQMLLIFPYTSGLRFSHTMLREKHGYRGVDDVFRSPPSSTEEILHPEKYLLKKRDYKVLSDEEILESVKLAGSKVSYRDTFGEFGTSLILAAAGNSKQQAADAAAGWGGDKAVVVQNSESSSPTRVIWQSLWDTVKDREEFLNAVKRNIEVRAVASGNIGEVSVGKPIELKGGFTFELIREAPAVTLVFTILSKATL